MKSTPAFKNTIREYLEKRGSKDPLFAQIVTKPGKNMDDCIQYILNTVKNSGCNGFTDDEVYNMAIHYFDEDNINIGGKIDCDVVVNHKVELTAEEKEEARKRAIDELVAETKKKLKQKPDTVKDQTVGGQKEKEKEKAQPVSGMLSFS
jgi:ribosome-associated translation inhibitor RaiA